MRDIPSIFSISNMGKLSSKIILLLNPNNHNKSDLFQKAENERNSDDLDQKSINKLKESTTIPNLITDNSIHQGVVNNPNSNSHQKVFSQTNSPFILSCPFNFKFKRIFIPYYFEQRKMAKMTELKKEEQMNKLKEQELSITLQKQLDVKRKEIVDQIKNEEKLRLEKFKNDIIEKNHQEVTSFCNEIIVNLLLNLNLSNEMNENEELNEIIISEVFLN